MTFSFDKEHLNFLPVAFYSYPTCVCDRITEYEDFPDSKPRFDRGDDDVKEFFEDCLKYAEEKLGRQLMDNKIAMKVVVPDTGQYFFVGYKDNIYTIGLTLNPYMTGNSKIIA